MSSAGVKKVRGAAKEAQRIELVDIICDAFELPKGTLLPSNLTAAESPPPPKKDVVPANDDDDVGDNTSAPAVAVAAAAPKTTAVTEKNVFAAVSDILEDANNSDEAMVMLQILRYKSKNAEDDAHRKKNQPASSSVAADLEKKFAEFEKEFGEDSDDEEEEAELESHEQQEQLTEDEIVRRRKEELEHRREIQSVMNRYVSEERQREILQESLKEAERERIEAELPQPQSAAAAVAPKQGPVPKPPAAMRCGKSVAPK